MFQKTVLAPIFQANDFQQRLQVDSTISDLTIYTVYFPIIDNTCPKFNVNTTHSEEGRILQIGSTTCFGNVTCIHSEMVDLPNLKEEKGIPEPYSLFNNPYKLQLQVSFQVRDLVLQII